MNKTQLKLKGIQPPTKLENELKQFNLFMTRTIRSRFENMVLKKLTKTDIKKFSDTLIIDASYITTYNKLFKEFEKSISKQFTSTRIKEYIKKLYSRTNNYNKLNFSKINTNNVIDLEKILKEESAFLSAKIIETSNMVEDLKLDMLKYLNNDTVRDMNSGKTLTELYARVRLQAKRNNNRAELIARNELKNLNSQLSDKRAISAGATKAIWRTVGDEKTRPCHAKRDGMEYDITKGLYSSCDGKTLKPGIDEVNCRCYADYIVEF